MQMRALDGEDAALQRALAESMQTAGGLACKTVVPPHAAHQQVCSGLGEALHESQ